MRRVRVAFDPLQLSNPASCSPRRALCAERRGPYERTVWKRRASPNCLK